jgi:hypothetical protein
LIQKVKVKIESCDEMNDYHIATEKKGFLQCLIFNLSQDDIQTEVYIIAGVFGGITIILLLMVLGLACTIAR